MMTNTNPIETIDPEDTNLHGPDDATHDLVCCIRWLAGCFRARCEAAGQTFHCVELAEEMETILLQGTDGELAVYCDQTPESYALYFKTLVDQPLK